MSYQALYRAWRPETFTDMVGQDAITRTLKRQVMSGRIAHAYLFCGTRGTGKTTAAKVLSRAINCTNLQEGDPCGECEVCRALKSETCLDVVEMDAASNRRIDDIRSIIDSVNILPSVARYKVYIVDEVHMLTTEAFNALLKTLEEPPEHVVFIMATTDPQRLPATILSRCQRFDFRRIPVNTIIERLMVVLGGIGRTATDEALYEIASAAEGAMRDALSLMDVCLSYTDGEVTAELARDVLGTAGRGAMFEFVDALIDSDAGRALRQIDEMIGHGSDPQALIQNASDHLRSVMLATAVGEGLQDILEVTPEDEQRFRDQAARTTPVAVDRMLELFMRAEPDTRWATRPRTVLELAAVRACHPDKEPDARFDERLHRVEKLIEQGIPAAPARVEKKPTPKPAPKAPPKSAPVPSEAPPQEYLEGLKRLAVENKAIAAPLESMQFIRMDGDSIIVEFDKARFMHKRLLERKQEQIDQIMSEAFGRSIHVALTQQDGGEKKVRSVARTVIDQAQDIFPRDKIEIID